MENPLLQTRGLPRFSEIKPEHVEPAVRSVLDKNRANLRALLAGSHESVTWDGLVAPMEIMRHQLERIWSPVSHMNAVVNTEELRSAYNACIPELSDYATELGQNEALFHAYRDLAQRIDGTDPPRAKLLSDALRDFRLSGVALPDEKKDRFRAMAKELARLQSKFEENVLDATNHWRHRVTDEANLAGLPEHVKKRAHEAAESADADGWLFHLDLPTYQTVMMQADNRDLRQIFYEAWVTRASDQGPNAGQWDNSDLIEDILRLRHESARLLGFDDYTEYSLATKMADTPAEVLEFLEYLAQYSVPVARREYAELEAFAGHSLEAWDVAYYAERLKRQRFRVSEEDLRPYFPEPKVLDGLFQVVRRLFAIDIREATDVDTWHPDVRFFEIFDSDGRARGGFYVDLYARTHKRGGAWMDDCVGRIDIGEHREHPVAYLVCNFTPPSKDVPALLTHSDVVTLFHEFGHTLHHLLTRVDYPSLAGINGVAWDAVELPSQFLENYAWTRDVLPLISAHYQSGEPLPQEMFENLIGTRKFNAGLHSVRQLEFALLDFRLHREYSPDSGSRLAEIIDSVRREVAVVRAPDFNRFAHSFAHIFSGGYAAGYYSYKWAEVLAADAFEAVDEVGVFDPDVARRFLRSILETGGTRDAMAAYVEFRGRRPHPDALLRLYGIPTTEEFARQ